MSGLEEPYLSWYSSSATPHVAGEMGKLDVGVGVMPSPRERNDVINRSVGLNNRLVAYAAQPFISKNETGNAYAFAWDLKFGGAAPSLMFPALLRMCGSVDPLLCAHLIWVCSVVRGRASANLVAVGEVIGLTACSKLLAMFLAIERASNAALLSLGKIERPVVGAKFFRVSLTVAGLVLPHFFGVGSAIHQAVRPVVARAAKAEGLVRCVATDSGSRYSEVNSSWHRRFLSVSARTDVRASRPLHFTSFGLVKYG